MSIQINWPNFIQIENNFFFNFFEPFWFFYVSSKRSKPTNASSKETEKKSLSSGTDDDSISVRKLETNYDSEMHWMIGNRLKDIVDKNVPRFVYAKVKHEVSQEKGNQSAEVNRTTPVKDVVIQQSIPFSNEELKNILAHPLMDSDVLSTPPIDIRDPTLRSLPSVGRVLQYTMSETTRSALLKWKLKKISELGEQGFAELQQCE